MNTTDRMKMVISLLLDTEESLQKLENARGGGKHYPYAGGNLYIGDTKGSVVKRIEVARSALLKIKKELEEC